MWSRDEWWFSRVKGTAGKSAALGGQVSVVSAGAGMPEGWLRPPVPDGNRNDTLVLCRPDYAYWHGGGGHLTSYAATPRDCFRYESYLLIVSCSGMSGFETNVGIARSFELKELGC